MAFAAPDPNEETPGQGVPQAGQPVSAGGAGLGGSSKAAATPGQNVPAQPSAQLSSYLGANQPQAAALGQNVATTVGNQVNAAGSSIQPAVDIYTGQQYTVPTDAATNAAVASSPSSLTQAQQQSFENELGASAAAPNSADTFEASAPYQTLNTGIQNAVEQANLWNAGNNVADLSTALQPYEGSQATTGDTTLDSLLLSQSPGAYGQIQSAVAPASTLQSQLNAGATQADASLQNAIAQDTAATGAATGAAQNYATGLTNYLNQAVTTNQAAQTAQESANSTIYADAQSGNLTAADAQAMGIPAANATAFAKAYDNYNATNDAATFLRMNPGGGFAPVSDVPQLSLGSYLTQGAAGPTIDAASVATPQNYSDVAALQALLGQNSNVNLPINASTANLAGTGLGQNASDTYNFTAENAAMSPEEQSLQSIVNSEGSNGGASPFAQAQALLTLLQTLSNQGVVPGGSYTTNV